MYVYVYIPSATIGALSVPFLEVSNVPLTSTLNSIPPASTSNKGASEVIVYFTTKSLSLVAKSPSIFLNSGSASTITGSLTVISFFKNLTVTDLVILLPALSLAVILYVLDSF